MYLKGLFLKGGTENGWEERKLKGEGKEGEDNEGEEREEGLSPTLFWDWSGMIIRQWRIALRQWLNSAGTGRNGVLQPVSGVPPNLVYLVPPPEIAVPPPKVVVPPPDNDVPSTFWTRKPSCRWQTRARRESVPKLLTIATCLQRCRWQYWSSSFV